MLIVWTFCGLSKTRVGHKIPIKNSTSLASTFYTQDQFITFRKQIGSKLNNRSQLHQRLSFISNLYLKHFKTISYKLT